MKWWGFFCLLFLLFPYIGYAEVVINEIAWMGSTASAQDEWIELFNTGADAVDLSGWKLIAVDGVPSITLSGSIDREGFFLIERTDDDSVLDVSADLIAPFGAGLANTGETLVLKNGSGTEVDRVEGGENWESVGGSNTTKQTAQRQSDGTWGTAEPTPRAENGLAIDPGDDSSGETGTTNSTRYKPPANAYVQRVFVYAGQDHDVVVGADTHYEAFAVDELGDNIRNGTFVWSFGDGGTAEGKVVYHAYRVPGTYIVVVRFRGHEQEWRETITITAHESHQHIGRIVYGTDGYVEIVNDDPAELDISGWRLQRGSQPFSQRKSGKQFVFPQDTYIASQSSIAVPQSTLNFALDEEKDTLLLYPDGRLASRYTPGIVEDLSDEKIVEQYNPVGSQQVTVIQESSTIVSPKMYETISPVPREASSSDTSTSSFEETMSASVGGASIILSGGAQNTFAHTSWVYISLVMIGCAILVGGVFAYRQPQKVEKSFSEITAEDIEIIT